MSAISRGPRRSVIVNSRPPKNKEGLKEADEICTCNIETDRYLLIGDNTGLLRMIDKETGTPYQVNVTVGSPAPVRAIGIGREKAVVVFGGFFRIMGLAGGIHLVCLSEPTNLKKYFATDRSNVAYPRYAAMRSNDDGAFAIICGDGHFVVVQTNGQQMLKRGLLQNGNPRGLCFVGTDLYAFDEQNRRYVLPY